MSIQFLGMIGHRLSSETLPRWGRSLTATISFALGCGPQPQRFSACGLTVADPRPVSGEPAAAAGLFCQQSDAAADRIRLKALCIFV